MLELAKNGMNVARLNMTHGEQSWHADVIQRVRKLNDQGCASPQSLCSVSPAIPEGATQSSQSTQSRTPLLSTGAIFPCNPDPNQVP